VERILSGEIITRNKRSVWTVATQSFKEAHFATFPPDLIKPCILAGTKPNDLVLDPFGGSGTTGMVALELGRRAVLIELNPQYVKLIEQRCNVTPGLALADFMGYTKLSDIKAISDAPANTGDAGTLRV
jgi:DNA modification methylase